MTLRLDGRVAVVTGAGSGMGRAIARLFAAEGARVVIADVVKAPLDETATLIKNAGGESTSVVADVSKEPDVARMVKTAVESYGTLDVLVNNAGIMDNVDPVDATSIEQWNRVLGVNLHGPFYACRLALPIMLAKGKGAIVNIASIAGLHGGRAGAAYTTSKHGLIGMTRNIAYMYATKGIRANVVAPGATATNIGASMRAPNEFGMARLGSGMPTNPRTAQPEEIATIALFLASDDASNVNGAVITADSGWTAY